MWARLAACSLLVAGLAHCGALLGVGEFHDSGSGGSTGSAASGAHGAAGTHASASMSASGSMSASTGEGGGGGSPCAGECVPALPWNSGFSGFFQLKRAAFTTTPYSGTCTPFYEKVTGAEAVCTGCACGGLTGATCAPPELELFNGDPVCKSMPMAMGSNGCISSDPIGGSFYASATPGAWNLDGSCPPDGSNVTKQTADPVVVGDEGCDANMSGSCDPSKTCVRSRDSSHPLLCVTGPVAQACPTQYPMPFSDYRDYSDKRGCSCACAPAAVTCAGGSDIIYGCVGCSAVCGTRTITPGTCTNIQNLVTVTQWSFQVGADSMPASGSCKPYSEPQGNIVPTNPVRLCCRQQ